MGGEEAEVASFVGLGDFVEEELAVAAGEFRWWWRPLAAAACEFRVADEEFERAVGDVELDEVACLDEGERATRCGFRGHVQDAGAVAGAAHAGVRDADHVADAGFEEFLRDGEHAPFWHAGAAERTGVAENENGFRGDVEVVRVDDLLEFRVGIEDEGGAGMGEQVRVGGGGFDDGSVWAEVAAEDEGTAFWGERVLWRQDDIGVEDFGVCDVFAE